MNKINQIIIKIVLGLILIGISLNSPANTPVRSDDTRIQNLTDDIAKHQAEFPAVIDKIMDSQHNSYLEIGDQYFNKGNYDIALNQYNMAIQLKPEDKVAYYKVAATLDKMQRYNEAKEILKKAKELEEK